MATLTELVSALNTISTALSKCIEESEKLVVTDPRPTITKLQEDLQAIRDNLPDSSSIAYDAAREAAGNLDLESVIQDAIESTIQSAIDDVEGHIEATIEARLCRWERSLNTLQSELDKGEERSVAESEAAAVANGTTG